MARDTRSNQDARMDARAGEGVRGRAERPRRRRATEFEHSSMGERLIAGVPARIMAPRLVFIVCLAALCSFGLLMVYSASSVEALQETGSSTYFLVRQLINMAIGLAFILIMCIAPAFSLESYRFFWTKPFWVIIMGLLVLVKVIGAGSGGAVRWIDLGFTTIQPSEFAKPVAIIIAARLAVDYFIDREIDSQKFIKGLVLGIGLPLALVFVQPDMGSTLIIAVAVFFMLVLSGLPGRYIVYILGVFAVAGTAALVAQPYRIARLMVAIDPWKDPYGDGYQATLAIMAFASGGLFGRGIGGSTMKYNYLPEAHNDYILAIIGEELGLVGTVIFFAVFIALLVSAFRIGTRCPNRFGRLIAYGSSLMLGIQFFVNVMGILGVTPMTGKPIPFISYGGSSVLTSMIMAGLILRVSIESNQTTIHDVRRQSLSVVDRDRGGRATSSGFSVLTGGGSARGESSRGRSSQSGSPRQGGSTRGARSSSTSSRGPAGYGRTGISGGYDRVNLNGDPSDRLRSRDSGPRVNRYDGSGRRDNHGGRTGYSNSTRRGRYDR